MLQVSPNPILGDSEYRDCEQDTYCEGRRRGKGGCRRMVSRHDVQHIRNGDEKEKSPDEG